MYFRAKVSDDDGKAKRNCGLDDSMWVQSSAVLTMISFLGSYSHFGREMVGILAMEHIDAEQIKCHRSRSSDLAMSILMN